MTFEFASLAGWLVLTYATAAVGALATMDAASFYGQLARPSWAPSPSLFGPVWSVLYTLMGLSVWLVWRQSEGGRRGLPVALYLIQLAVNALWSWLFFSWHLGAAALADVLILLVLNVAMMLVFWRVRPLAGMLLLPYAAWVGFASALTWTVWQSNPTVLG